MRTLQPLLHEQVVLVAAPTQALCAPDGSMGADPVQGLFHSDVRALRIHRLTVTGSDLEPLSTTRLGAAGARFTALARDLDPTGADPRTVLTATRTLTAAGTTGRLTEELVLEAAWPQPVTTTLTLTLTADLSGMDLVKSGRSEGDLPWQLATGADGSATATTARGAATVRVQAAGAQLATSSDAPTELTLTWQVRADATHPFHALWSLEATDDDAVVVPALTLPAPARTLVTDPRARAWSQVALDDVAHLLELPGITSFMGTNSFSGGTFNDSASRRIAESRVRSDISVTSDSRVMCRTLSRCSPGALRMIGTIAAADDGS